MRRTLAFAVILSSAFTVLLFRESLFFKVANMIFGRSENCYHDCNTPYGDILGITSGNVVAYSNCNPDCLIIEPHKEDGVITGIKWQCVEFARRWLLKNRGVVIEEVETAADIWFEIDSVTRPADGKRLYVSSYVNGSEVPPKMGDLLVYDKTFLNTGHVAVVMDIDVLSGRVKVAEQNLQNKKWRDGYSREIVLFKHGSRHWLLDAFLIGWKRVTGDEREPSQQLQGNLTAGYVLWPDR